MEGQYFLFLISLTACISSFPQNHNNCSDVYTGMCLGNGFIHPSGSTGQISWICGGSFGRLNLSCSKVDTHKTADSINCEVALISLGQKGESEKSSLLLLPAIHCGMNLTGCGEESLSNKTFICRWDQMCLLINHGRSIQLHRLKRHCDNGFHQANRTQQERRNKTMQAIIESILSSLPQQTNCSLHTVMCTEKRNTTLRGITQSLQGSISWNCASSSTQVYIDLTCKRFEEIDEASETARMCCEAIIKKGNSTPTAGPASCLLISTRFDDDTIRVWDCHWKQASLRILPKLEETADVVRHKTATYYVDCNTPNNRSHLQNCTETHPSSENGNTTSIPERSTVTSPILTTGYQIKTTPKSHRYSTVTTKTSNESFSRPKRYSTTQPTTKSKNYSTAAPTKPGNPSTEKPTNLSTEKLITQGNQSIITSLPHGSTDTGEVDNLSSVNKTLKALSKRVNEETSLFNCTASSIQKLLVNIDDLVHPLLRTILKASDIGRISLSYRLDFIEFHMVVTADFNKTITVPEQDDGSQGSVSLLPGSIDLSNGRLGIFTYVFMFERLCNRTEGLHLDTSNSNGSSSLQSPIVSVVAMNTQGNINALQDNANISFRIMSADPSSTKCVFLNRSSSSSRPTWSSKGMTLVQGQKKHYTTCLTDHFTSFAVLIDYQKDSLRNQLSKNERIALDLITKIGCGVTLVCLAACIFTFACVRSLSAVRYRIHLNLCIALAAAQLVFIAGIEATDIKNVCIAVAIILHYFFTASFSWMCMEAFHLFTKIVSVFSVQRIRMRHYFALGWGIPAVIVIISMSVHFNRYTGSEVCWLSLEGDFIWAFISPVIIMALINLAVLIAVIVVRVSLKGNPLTPRENKKFAAALKTVIVLFPLLGLCWVFGLLAVVTKNRPFLYAFVVLSSLQGAFIFLFQCIGSSEVRGSIKAVKNRYSIESSLRHEKKSKMKDSQMDGNHKSRNNTERKCLLTRLSVTNYNRKNKQNTSTSV